MVQLEEEQVRTLLREYVCQFSTQTMAARSMGIHPNFLSDVLNRRLPIGPTIMEIIGVEKVVTYRKKETQADGD